MRLVVCGGQSFGFLPRKAGIDELWFDTMMNRMMLTIPEDDTIED
jgi:hypothetical protein